MERYYPLFTEKTEEGKTESYFLWRDKGWVKGKEFGGLAVAKAAMQPMIMHIHKDTSNTDELLLAYAYQDNIKKGYFAFVDQVFAVNFSPKDLKGHDVPFGPLKAAAKNYVKRGFGSIFDVTA